MKGVKGRILTKLRSIPHVGYLKQGPVLHLDASESDDFSDPRSPPTSGRILRDLPVSQDDQQSNSIDVSELMSDTSVEEEEDKEEVVSSLSNKENTDPVSTTKDPTPKKSNIESVTERILFSELSLQSFRRPDLNSSTLFDPDLLAAFNQAVMDHFRSWEDARSRARATEEEKDPYRDEGPPPKMLRTDDEDPLMEFEDRCPPGGREAVILYTTSLRGIRKTFQDCKSVKFLLKSLKVLFYERDVSMHLEFREELWRVLGGRAIPPRLFIRGRYIGGADEVLGLHEQGQLVQLMKGLPLDRSAGIACEGCGGIRFVVCSECYGSRRIYADEIVECHRCNENGDEEITQKDRD